jgi:hypothetical protein
MSIAPRPLAAVAALATLALGMPLRAQVSEITRTSLADAAQLTFGHLCEDRFVVRNDGTQPVTLAYALERATEQQPLTIGAREQVELAATGRRPLELWKDGRRLAVAERTRRKCRDVQGTAAVQVQPLEVATRDGARPQPTMGYGVGWGLGWGASPWIDPWFGAPFGAWNARGPRWGGVIAVPVVVGRGGRRR